MKRTILGAFALVLTLALGLSSCDAFFETNLFAKATHPELTDSELKSKSPNEIADLLASAEYKAQIFGSAGKKAAILSALTAKFPKSGDDPSETGQTAAIIAAEVYIESDPAAAYVSSTLLASIADLADGAVTPGDAGTIIANLLPTDLQSEIGAKGSTAPEAFSLMIQAFLDANTAYTALGSNLEEIDLEGGETGHVYAGDVPAMEALPIAVKALLSAFLSAIQPVSPYTRADALWSAIVDLDVDAEADVTQYLTIDADVVKNLIAEGNPVKNLLEAAGLNFTIPATGG